MPPHPNKTEAHDAHRLRVEDLSVYYGKICALQNINFDAKCGSSLAVTGANGAGKSTLLKTLAGLIKPNRGKMSWRGKDLVKSSYEICYLPQREEVDWNFPLSVKGLVEMGRYPKLGLLKKYRPEDEKIVAKAIKQMQLQGFENRMLRELSGGQQQRAFIARALAQEAHVLLLDEPFNSLDRQNQENLAKLLKNMSKKNKRLIIASSHANTFIKSSFQYIMQLDRKIIFYKKNPNYDK